MDVSRAGRSERAGLGRARPRLTFALAVCAALMAVALIPVAAFSASDDNIPGADLSAPGATTGNVSSEDVNDVYAVDLTSGREVRFYCDPGTTGEASGRFHLIVPGASSLSDLDGYEELRYSVRSGTVIRWVADFAYMPAKSGTYYVWVEWGEGSLSYALTVARTSANEIDADDSDDIPGIAVGNGSHEGVIDTFADHDDVYALTLTAGQELHLELGALGSEPFGTAHLNLLAPESTSITQMGERRIITYTSMAHDETAAIDYTPTEAGTYYVWVEAGMFASNMGYRLTIQGAGSTTTTTAPHGTTTTTQPTDGFTDVPSDHPYATQIDDLAGRGIVEGFGGGLFKPDDWVRRQQFAKMIVLTMEYPVSETDACPFSDVDRSASGLYPDHYVAVAAAEGVTEGTAPGLFSPWDNITRAQLITMVARAAELSDPPAGYEPPFSDFSPTHYPWARRAAFAGLLQGLQGVGPGYDFWAPATRGEVCVVLSNLLHR